MAEKKEKDKDKGKEGEATAAGGLLGGLLANKKALMIGGGAFLGWSAFLLVLGWALFGGTPPAPDDKAQQGGTEVAKPEGLVVGTMVDVPQMDVGYSSPKDANPYISIQVSLELNPQTLPEASTPEYATFKNKLDASMPVIMEIIHDAVMVRERSELVGKQNKDALLREVLEEVNKLLERAGFKRPVTAIHLKRYFFSE